MESQQKLELFVSCRSIADVDTFSKSDPYCIMFVKKVDRWVEMSRTELIQNNLNPNFAKSFIIDYFFEVQQYLRFEVHHFVSKTESKLIGTCETTLGAIAGSKDQVFVSDLREGTHGNRGKIIVRADQVKSCNDNIKMILAAEKVHDTRFWFWHCTNPFLRIYRLRKDDANPVLVYETEFIGNNLKPLWKMIEIKAQKLCNGDYLMPLKVEMWDYRKNGSHIYLGETQFSVSELTNQQTIKQLRELKDKKTKKSRGNLVVQEFHLYEKPTFMDYIMGGIQLNLVVAIDFTASNQNPHHQSSLHYQDPMGRMNQYQQAILSVGEILVNYDYDQKIPVYGFGCKPRLPNLTSTSTLHCFPINGNIQYPEVDGLDGIMKYYASFLHQCQFDGPTYFTPLLNEIMKTASQSRDTQSDNYYILLILTDGEIHDMKTTIDAIVASSHLPLSIIIIGVGNQDFSNMNILDNDDLSMADSFGRKAQRDLVQFVPFNEFKGNPELLAKNVLEELPDQLVDYFQLIKRKPNARQQINLNNFNLDINDEMTQFKKAQVVQNIPQQQNIQNYPPQQQQFPQQYPPSSQYQQIFQPNHHMGMGTYALGQGMVKGGFLAQHIQSANNQYNYPP